MTDGWGLVGQGRAVARASDALARSPGVLIAGPAGVGKTRLAHEVVAHLRSAGTTVTSLQATPSAAMVPLATLAPLLPPGSPMSPFPLFPILRDALAGPDPTQPSVLAIDDIGNLDDSSATLVHQLVTTSTVRLLATHRTGTDVPEEIARLWRDGLVGRIDLRELDEHHTEELAARIAGAPLDDASAAELWRLTSGNPLFVRELLIAARSAGTLVEEGGVARLEAVPGGEPRLVDFVRDRLRGLGEPAERALLVISLAEPIDDDRLPSWIDDEVLADLDAAGLVRSELDGARVRIGLSHPLHGEVLRANASGLQLRAAHRELVEAADRAGAADADPVRYTRWAAAAGRTAPAAVVLRAAQTARFAGDVDVALDLAEQVWATAPDFEVGDLLADLHYERGDPEACDRHRAAWEATATTPDERIRLRMNEAITALWRAGDADRAWQALDRAETEPPSPWRDEARAVRATLLAVAGHPTDAIAIAEPLLERAPDRVLIQAALALSHAYRAVGRVDDAIAVCDDAIAAYGQLGEQVALFTTRVLSATRAIALAEAGRLEDAAVQAADGLRASRELDEPGSVGLAALVEGLVHFQRGQMGAATAAYHLAESSFRAAHHPGMVVWACDGVAMAAAVAGDVDAARAAIERAAPGRDHPARVLASFGARAEAWTAHAAGDPLRARAVLAAAASTCRERGDLMGAAGCLHDLARLGGDAAHAAELRALADDGQGTLLAAMAAHAQGLALGDLDRLAAAVEQFEAIGMSLCAAEAAFAAADLARRDGDPRAASAWAQRGDQARANCDAAMTPGLVADLAPVPLTRREREIALLAAQGIVAREIGERLFVSRRTVESHLGRVYAKLGVRSRTELAEVLARQGVGAAAEASTAGIA